MKKLELPSTLELYRDTGKWILGLAIGGLSGFIGVSGFSERLANSPLLLRIVFAFGGLAVLVAVSSGVLFVLYLAQFGNALEKEQDLAEDKKKTEAERADLAQELENRKKSARRWVGPWYRVMFVSFFISLFTFGGVGCWMLFGAARPETKIAWSFDGEKVTGTLQPVTKSDSSEKVKELVELVNLMNATYGKPKAQVSTPVPTCSPAPPIVVNITPCCENQSQPIANCPQCRSKKGQNK